MINDLIKMVDEKEFADKDFNLLGYMGELDRVSNSAQRILEDKLGDDLPRILKVIHVSALAACAGLEKSEKGVLGLLLAEQEEVLEKYFATAFMALLGVLIEDEVL